mgnify:CR=1 FL=1
MSLMDVTIALAVELSVPLSMAVSLAYYNWRRGQLADRVRDGDRS